MAKYVEQTLDPCGENEVSSGETLLELLERIGRSWSPVRVSEIFRQEEDGHRKLIERVERRFAIGLTGVPGSVTLRRFYATKAGMLKDLEHTDDRFVMVEFPSTKEYTYHVFCYIDGQGYKELGMYDTLLKAVRSIYGKIDKERGRFNIHKRPADYVETEAGEMDWDIVYSEFLPWKIQTVSGHTHTWCFNSREDALSDLKEFFEKHPKAKRVAISRNFFNQRTSEETFFERDEILRPEPFRVIVVHTKEVLAECPGLADAMKHAASFIKRKPNVALRITREGDPNCPILITPTD